MTQNVHQSRFKTRAHVCVDVETFLGNAQVLQKWFVYYIRKFYHDSRLPGTIFLFFKLPRYKTSVILRIHVGAANRMLYNNRRCKRL